MRIVNMLFTQSLPPWMSRFFFLGCCHSEHGENLRRSHPGGWFFGQETNPPQTYSNSWWWQIMAGRCFFVVTFTGRNETNIIEASMFSHEHDFWYKIMEHSFKKITLHHGRTCSPRFFCWHPDPPHGVLRCCFGRWHFGSVWHSKKWGKGGRNSGVIQHTWDTCPHQTGKLLVKFIH